MSGWDSIARENDEVGEWMRKWMGKWINESVSERVREWLCQLVNERATASVQSTEIKPSFQVSFLTQSIQIKMLNTRSPYPLVSSHKCLLINSHFQASCRTYVSLIALNLFTYVYFGHIRKWQRFTTANSSLIKLSKRSKRDVVRVDSNVSTYLMMTRSTTTSIFLYGTYFTKGLHRQLKTKLHFTWHITLTEWRSRSYCYLDKQTDVLDIYMTKCHRQHSFCFNHWNRCFVIMTSSIFYIYLTGVSTPWMRLQVTGFN
jgi:hypothetical protein